MMTDRQQHQQEVRDFLIRQFQVRDWRFELPHGWGQESYFAYGGEHSFFVKLGAQVPRYRILAALGLTPEVLASGQLADGTSILVQPLIEGRTPNRADYRAHLEQFARTIHQVHNCADLKQILPEVASDSYQEAGLRALRRIQNKWQQQREQVPEFAGFVDKSLAELERRVGRFEGGGLVASHNDICNANWLLTMDGKLYLIDLDSMSLDDPALDIGATLWWYIPPGLRQRFLEIVGHADEAQFPLRMQVRMAMHCLDIALPREGSFDQLTPESFAGWLVDFKSAFEGKENPQGYD
jgi:thiamine kinase-like enzyme